MAGAKRSTWIGATVFGALVIAAATWFGAVSPVEAKAADLRSQTADTLSKNAQLQHKIDQLKKDFAKLPEYKQQLADLQVQIPTDAQLSDYLRQVDQIATAHDVTIVSLSPGTPQAFVSPKAGKPAAAAADSGTISPTDSGSPTPTPSATATAKPSAPAAAAAVAPTGLVDIPVSFDVVGTYDNTLAFVSDLQTATPRLFLLTQLTATAQKTDQPAAGGKPALHVGDQEITLNGFLYVLPDASAPAQPAASSASPTTLPAPVPNKNPLVPIAGQ